MMCVIFAHKSRITITKTDGRIQLPCTKELWEELKSLLSYGRKMWHFLGKAQQRVQLGSCTFNQYFLGIKGVKIFKK